MVKGTFTGNDIISVATEDVSTVPPKGYYGDTVVKPPRVDNYEASPSTALSPTAAKKLQEIETNAHHGPFAQPVWADATQRKELTGMTGDGFRQEEGWSQEVKPGATTPQAVAQSKIITRAVD